MSSLARLFDREDSLSDLLPYFDYDPEGNVFIQVDGRLGVGWTIQPVPSETESDSARGRLAELAEKVILEIPPGYAGQFVVEVNSEIEHRLGEFARLGGGSVDDGIPSLLSAAKCRRYVEGCRNGFWPGDPFRARHFEFYMLIISPPPGRPSSGLLEWIATGRKQLADRFHSRYLDLKADLLRRGSAVEKGLESLGLRPCRVDLNALMGVVYRALNPARCRDIKFGNEATDDPGISHPFRADSRPLREQAVHSECRVDGEGLLIEGYRAQAFSLTGLPGSVGPGLLNTLLERYTGNLLVTLNFTTLSLEESRGSLGAKRFFAGRQAKSVTGQENISAKLILEELDDALREIEGKNKRLVCFALHAVSSTPPDHAQEAADSILRSFSYVGAQATRETAVAIPVFLSSLPLGFDPKLDVYLRRLRRVLSDRFAMFSPLWGYFSGTRTPTQLYLTRQGLPITIDPLDCDTSPHGLILATSGAGKSFFTNDMLAQARRLAPEPYIFVIDVGGSYRKLCEMLDGDYAQIELRAPTCVNPFADEMTDANLALWVPLLAQMVRDPEAEEPVTRDQKVLFELALRAAFENKRSSSPSNGEDEEVVLSDITAALRMQGPLGETLALRLFPFTRKGRFGAFFDGPTQLRVGNRFTVFDLTEAKDQVELRGPLMMSIMNLIIRIVRDEGHRAVRKYLMIDEAWAFLKDPASAEFIREAYKTFRKYTGLVFVITQDVLDLIQFPAGEAILSNAPNVFLLKQQPKAIEALAKHLHLNENQVRTVQSVHMRKGYYSEAYFMTTFEGATRDGVLRLVPDPVSYWVSTTDGADVQAFHERLRKVGDRMEAIRTLAEEFPRGVAAGR